MGDQAKPKDDPRPLEGPPSHGPDAPAKAPRPGPKSPEGFSDTEGETTQLDGFED